MAGQLIHTDSMAASQPIKGHHYQTGHVLISLSIFIWTDVGFRGVGRCFSAFREYGASTLRQMSYSCVRQWILRLGYGLLHQMPEWRRDWIYLMDYSIQVGDHRCLLILGVPQQRLLKHAYDLCHEQMQVLDIYISPTHKAQEVYQRLNYCAQRTGVPLQIICDQGADVRTASELFRQDYPEVIRSYDITHKIGSLLKKYLSRDERWQELQADLRSLTHQIKQTELSFLRPLTLSQKSRWLNIDKLISSLANIYKYEEQGNFDLISQGYKIGNHEKIAAYMIGDGLNNNANRKLRKRLATTVFEVQKLPNDSLWKDVQPWSSQIEWVAAGQQRFEQKFASLQKHKAFFKELEQAYFMLSQIKALVKSEGLNLDTLQQIEQYYPKTSTTWICNLYRNLNNYLVQEHAKAGANPNPMLICSDVIESIFGKFKAKTKQSVGGLYNTVLMIPLFCQQLCHHSIKAILQKTSLTQVEQWMLQMQGASNLAKRRQALK